MSEPLVRCTTCGKPYPLSEYVGQKVESSCECRRCKYARLYGAQHRWRAENKRAVYSEREARKGEAFWRSTYAPGSSDVQQATPATKRCKSCGESKPYEAYGRHLLPQRITRSVCDECYERVLDAFDLYREHFFQWNLSFKFTYKELKEGTDTDRAWDKYWEDIDRKSNEEAELFPRIKSMLRSSADVRNFTALFVRHYSWRMRSFCEGCFQWKPRNEFRGVTAPSRFCKECHRKFKESLSNVRESVGSPVNESARSGVDSPDYQQCRKCRKWLHRDDFPKTSTGRKQARVCRVCKAQQIVNRRKKSGNSWFFKDNCWTSLDDVPDTTLVCKVCGQEKSAKEFANYTILNGGARRYWLPKTCTTCRRMVQDIVDEIYKLNAATAPLLQDSSDPRFWDALESKSHAEAHLLPALAAKLKNNAAKSMFLREYKKKMGDSLSRQCSLCGEIRPAVAFKKNPNGLRSTVCTGCASKVRARARFQE